MKFKTVSNGLLLYLILFLTGVFTSCRESAWDEHVTKDELLKKNLAEAVGLNSDLSTFNSILKLTGYDHLLQSAGSFTVFAPTNNAWVGFDLNDTLQMRQLVGTLITFNSYFTSDNALYLPLKSVNGKNIYYDVTSARFNGAQIIEADNRTANGVIHVTDLIVERKKNIMEYLFTESDSRQFQYIDSLSTLVMDVEKSVDVGVDSLTGATQYDTIWKNSNAFLDQFPIDNEDSIYTYIVLKNSGFDALYTKYNPYFRLSNAAATDSITRLNVCMDFVFKGIVDITSADTLTNVNGVKVPFKDVHILDMYNASNGRVYVIEESNILLSEKIKPIKIEGENFNRVYDQNVVFTRYKTWASGKRDIVLSSGETQPDTLWRVSTGVKDSAVSKTYFINSGIVANVNNFYIEFKTSVNSTDYDLYYVAYDDITDHFDWTYTNYGVKKVVQKMFISLPGGPTLKHGITDNARGVANNYLGNTRCFVGQGMAGIHEVTKLKQWSLVETTQLLNAPVNGLNADILSVSKTGTMTIWLCNSALSNTANRQGLLFLDYILLVPRITQE